MCDPYWGAGGMLVQSTKFVERHQGRLDALAIYGQESNPITWKLEQMNLAIHGLKGALAKGQQILFLMISIKA